MDACLAAADEEESGSRPKCTSGRGGCSKISDRAQRKNSLRKSNVLQEKMGIPLIEGAVARRGYQVRIPEKSQENNTFYRKNKESRDK